MQGNFSKIRGRFDSIRPVMTTEDQGPGRWEQKIWGRQCKSIDNQQHKTKVIENRSGVYQLGSARNNFENQRKSNQEIREKFGQQKTRDRVGGSKQVIGERVIRRKEQSGSECCVASDQGASDW